ncbi:fimbrial protein [Escherichia coli]|nr:fimbrial protein [Escherichia coli]
MIWQPEFTDKTLSRKPGAVQFDKLRASFFILKGDLMICQGIITLISDVDREGIKCLFIGVNVIIRR